MATIPQKELRNNSAEVLRRAEAGERLTITVSGRPVAELGPVRRATWVSPADAAAVWAAPVTDPESFMDDIRAFPAPQLTDPWA